MKELQAKLDPFFDLASKNGYQNDVNIAKNIIYEEDPDPSLFGSCKSVLLRLQEYAYTASFSSLAAKDAFDILGSILKSLNFVG